MKKIILSIVAVLAVMVSAGAQEAMTTQRYAAKDFTSLSISNAFEVQLVKSDTYRVTLEYPTDCAKYISVARQKATLFIGLKNKTPRKWMNGKHEFRAIVEMPEVYGIYLSGATKLASEDLFLMNMHPFEVELSGAAKITSLSVDGPSVNIELSGASRADINVNAGEVEADVSGASKLTLTGNVTDLTIDASGASSVHAKNVNATNVDVDGSGASKIFIFVERELKVDLSGASKCEYIGPDEIILRSIDITGASALKKVQ
ncbi:MAG: DUF2807 domain-containing protein [Bacteroidales bacterium]|nr:DUF2807 domain-containing protein [Bacteroidales bacterium]